MGFRLAGLGPPLGTVARRLPADAWALVWGLLVWTWRHLRWVLFMATVGFVVRLFPNGQPPAIRLLVLGWLAPALLAVVWARWWPV